MSSIVVNNQRYPLTPGATVLDTLLEAGLELSYGCRAGACQSCLVRASAGTIPPEAQHGLKEALKAQGWFLACRCTPVDELTIDLTADTGQQLNAQVVKKQLLSPRVMGLWLKPEHPLAYRAGQYISLWRDSSSARSYSLASLPEYHAHLELHISRVDGGLLSNWVHDELQSGDEVQIQGPMGDSVYIAGDSGRPLLLIGTGTGLAPLYGVVRDALHQGHSGPIHLFHGARNLDYLYYHVELMALAKTNDNLHYHPSLVEADTSAPEGVEFGAVDQIITRHLPRQLDGWRVYLSGAPDIVNRLRTQCFLAGASSRDIYTDPFA